MTWHKRLLAVPVLLACLAAAPAAEARGSAWVFKVGAQYQAKPYLPASQAWAFALAFQNEYWFAGPMWFEYGSGLGVNGTYFDWALQAGLLLKVPTSTVLPTFHARFLFDWRQWFEKRAGQDTADFVLGASFGPGVRYVFGDSGRGILLDFDFVAGKLMRAKTPYFAFLPMFGVQL